jgi:hypothetical protein
MQNEEKIDWSIVSEVMLPVISPMWLIARRISSARSSDDMPFIRAECAETSAVSAAVSAS